MMRRKHFPLTKFDCLAIQKRFEMKGPPDRYSDHIGLFIKDGTIEVHLSGANHDFFAPVGITEVTSWLTDDELKKDLIRDLL